MMKLNQSRSIVFIGCFAFLQSCASLYNPPAMPHSFLEKKDGTALDIGAGTNYATNYVNVNATKAVSDAVSLNVGATTSFMGNYHEPNNPFNNSKNFNQLAVNVGWNTTAKTQFPFMLWAGLNTGQFSDAYAVAPFFNPLTGDFLPKIGDSSLKFERAQGSYIGTRFGIGTYIVTNYGINANRKARTKLKFDIISTATLTPVRFNFSSGNTKAANTTLVGLNNNLRLYNNKRMLAINFDINASAKQLMDDLVGNKNPLPEMEFVPQVYPSISYTWFLKKKK
jgi:hypothetical protein